MTQIFLGIAPMIWGWSAGMAMLFFAGSSIFYLVLFRVFKLWGPKTFTMFGSPVKTNNDENEISNVN
jgi:hypothetical protein